MHAGMATIAGALATCERTAKQYDPQAWVTLRMYRTSSGLKLDIVCRTDVFKPLRARSVEVIAYTNIETAADSFCIHIRQLGRDLDALKERRKKRQRAADIRNREAR